MVLNPPSTMLKAVWLVHFVLTSWAMLSGLLPVLTYFFTHVLVMAIGLWSIIDKTSADAVLMFLLTLGVSVVNDIILLGIYEPRGHDIYEDEDAGPVSSGRRNEYRFALGMCITNLLFKPISMFLVYRIYQSRNDGSDFNAGIPGIPGFGGSSSRGEYDDISPASTPSKESGYQEPPSSTLR